MRREGSAPNGWGTSTTSRCGPGRVIDGMVYTDAEVDERLREAMRRAREARGGQSPADALAGLGFEPQALGAEAPSKEAAGKRPKKKKYDPVEADRNHPCAHVLDCWRSLLTWWSGSYRCPWGGSQGTYARGSEDRAAYSPPAPSAARPRKDRRFFFLKRRTRLRPLSVCSVVLVLSCIVPRGSEDREAASPPAPGAATRSAMACFRCGGRGHKARDCGVAMEGYSTQSQPQALSPEYRLEAISRAMVRALRHGEDAHIVNLRTDGFASIRNLLRTRALTRLGATEAEILEAVSVQLQAGEVRPCSPGSFEAGGSTDRAPASGAWRTRMGVVRAPWDVFCELEQHRRLRTALRVQHGRSSPLSFRDSAL